MPAEGERAPRERRSRDRYGRDRREEGSPSDQTAAAQPTAPAEAEGAAVMAASAASAADSAAPVARARPAPAAEPVAELSAAPAPAQAAPTPSAPAASSGLPKVQPYQLPLQDLEQVASASGLQWVNSDAQKIAATQAAMAAEPKPAHVPRERPPAVVIDEGPLVLVETRRDLSELKLPFESGAQVR